MKGAKYYVAELRKIIKYSNNLGKMKKNLHFLLVYILGVKVRNIKMNFNTGGTWRWVKQLTLIMFIYDYMISLCRIVAKKFQSCHLNEDGRFFQL